MNIQITTVLILSVIALALGADPTGKTGPVGKATKKASTKPSTSSEKKAPATASGKHETKPAEKKKETAHTESNKPATEKTPTMTIKKGKLNHHEQPMKDEPAPEPGTKSKEAAATDAKSKDKTKTTKGSDKTDAGSVTVSPDATTQGKGQGSRHLVDWKLVALVIVTVVLLRYFQ